MDQASRRRIDTDGVRAAIHRVLLRSPYRDQADGADTRKNQLRHQVRVFFQGAEARFIPKDLCGLGAVQLGFDCQIAICIHTAPFKQRVVDPALHRALRHADIGDLIALVAPQRNIAAARHHGERYAHPAKDRLQEALPADEGLLHSFNLGRVQFPQKGVDVFSSLLCRHGLVFGEGGLGELGHHRHRDALARVFILSRLRLIIQLSPVLDCRLHRCGGDVLHAESLLKVINFSLLKQGGENTHGLDTSRQLITIRDWRRCAA